MFTIEQVMKGSLCYRVEEAITSEFLPSLCGVEDNNKNKYRKLAGL